MSNDLRLRFDAQHNAFHREGTPDHRERMRRLGALLDGILSHQEALVRTVSEDFGNRAAQETRLLEIFPTVDEIRHTRRQLRQWMKPRRVSANWQFATGSGRIIYQPLGVVGIIGAWNYQILLVLSPLVNALAAGNRVMIKPSEMAPRTAELIGKIIAERFSPEEVTVVTGDAEVSAAFAALPFDHLIFTGSTRVGKLVMRAASENLTPVTLELGGKSPAIVHREYPLEKAAERILTGKFWNAGQTCIAPDYVMVPEDQLEGFMRAADTILAKRFPKVVDNPDYTRIVNVRFYERLNGMIEEARTKGGRVLQSNPANENCNADNRVIPPTLVANVEEGMKIMQEEIFGPILPVITYRELDDAIRYVNDRPRPLALYYFDNDTARISRVLDETTSGGATINDCIFHLPQHNLPFGGVGPSGMGAYHGFDGFVTFSKKKGVFIQGFGGKFLFPRFLSPPYSRFTDWLIRFLIGRQKNRRKTD
jgi:coniferyl-aldehyde dehydrogenase